MRGAKNQSKFLCMCVNAPLYVQLWPLISCSSQVQMPHFCFHRTYTKIFYLHCKFLNSMKKNKRINFSKKKKLKNLMAAPEKSYGTLKCSREIVICQPNSKFLKAKDSTWNCLQHDQAGILNRWIWHGCWAVGWLHLPPCTWDSFPVVTFKG